MNSLLSIGPSKEMEDDKRQRKKLSDLGGNRIHDLRIWTDLIVRCSTELRGHTGASRGRLCGNLNVKGTNECCAASTKDTNDGLEN